MVKRQSQANTRNTIVSFFKDRFQNDLELREELSGTQVLLTAQLLKSIMNTDSALLTVLVSDLPHSESFLFMEILLIS